MISNMRSTIEHGGHFSMIQTVTRHSESRGRKNALVLLGTFTAEEGMYEYFIAWRSQLEAQGIPLSKLSIGMNCDLHRCVVRNMRRGYAAHLLVFITRLPNILASIRDYSESLRKEGVEVIRVLDDFVYSSLYIFLLARYFKGDVIVTIHDPEPHPGHVTSVFSKIVYHTNRFLTRLVCKKQSNVYLHFHSKRLQRSAPAFSKLKHVIVPHPIPRARFVFEQKKPFDFILVGRLEPYKGIDIFLQAVSLLHQRRPKLFDQLNFALAGRGDISHYNDFGLPNLPNFKLINEFLPAKELHSLIAGSRYLVLPYTSGTASGVGVLAASYSVPVLVSDVGDLPDLVRYHDDSRVLSRIDPEALYEILEEKAWEIADLRARVGLG